MLYLIVLVVTVSLLQNPALAYKAAVVEHYATSSDTPTNTIRKNLEEYREYADKAHNQSVNIIVFPEYGLTTIVEDPAEYAQEITEDNEFIKDLKAIAVEHGLYLVVNLLEKVTEANKATKYYNTNLVFSTNGSIVLTYRKINLYEEAKLTKGADDQNVVFTTEFGITFGIFTCYDILFDNPSRRVLDNSGVTDVVFPSAWVSIIPFSSSLTVQHGYASATGVNLLAANYGQPKSSHGGSGIYAADGTIREIYISDTPSSKLLVQELPQRTTRPNKSVCSSITPFGLPGDPTRNNVSNYMTVRQFSASDYKFQNIDLTKQQVTTEVCDGEFCCTFDITIAVDLTSSDIYKVMAFDGVVNIDGSNKHVHTCSLVACKTDSTDTCGDRIDTTTRFTKITVKGNLARNETTFYAPVTLNKYLMPLTPTSYCDTKNGTNTTFVQLTTLKAQQDVLAFGLFEISPSGASIHASSLLLMVVFGLVKWILF